jgi:hypothetical protein
MNKNPLGLLRLKSLPLNKGLIQKITKNPLGSQRLKSLPFNKSFNQKSNEKILWAARS